MATDDASMLLDNPNEHLLFYRSELSDCIDFWTRNALDESHGGYLTFLDRKGKPYNHFKYTWGQGRATYLFAKLANSGVLPDNEDFLGASQLGAEFLKKYVLKDANRVYSKLTRTGDPIAWEPGSIFPEAFVVLGFAEYSKASGNDEYLSLAQSIFWNSVDLLESGALSRLAGEVVPYYKWHAPAMILLNVAQELREISANARLDEVIERWIEDELYVYTKDDRQMMFERVKLNNDVDLESHEGRSITPGHVLEACWFCLTEGLRNGNNEIIERTTNIIEWAMARGWDSEYGGLLNFVDYSDWPAGHHDEGWGEDQDWDDKIFWPHAEGLYALLLAWTATERQSMKTWYSKLHGWTFKHFPDREYGEWFGYLNRDGRPSQTLKGGMKGVFHIPRALLNCVMLLEKEL